MKQRLSNFELLRIIAMLGVITLHAVNILESADIYDSMDEAREGGVFCHFMIKTICCLAVPNFVLISGWFGIKPRLEGFLSFVFQNLFFSVGITLSMVMCGDGVCFMPVDFFLTWYWFSIAYMGLYLLAPILNAFCGKASVKEFVIVLCSFFCFQTLYGFLCNSSAGFNGGLSVFTLLGYYILGQFFRRQTISISKKGLLLGCCVCVLINTVLALMFSSCFPLYDRINFFNYTNPLIILAAVFFFLFFSKLKIQTNRVINFVAKSCFSVYLLHSHRLIIHGLFGQNIQSADSILGIASIVLLFFAVPILLDQIRIILWRCIVTVYTKYLPSKDI